MYVLQILINSAWTERVSCFWKENFKSSKSYLAKKQKHSLMHLGIESNLKNLLAGIFTLRFSSEWPLKLTALNCFTDVCLALGTTKEE